MSISLSSSVVMVLAAALCALVGVLAILRGLRQRRLASGFLARAVETSAELTELHPKDIGLGAEPETLYFAVVRFALPDGEMAEAECLTGTSSAPGRRGDQVSVRYDPRHPERVSLAETDDPQAGVGGSSLAVGRGLLLLALTIGAARLLLELVVRTS